MTFNNLVLSFNKVFIDLDPIYLDSWKKTIAELKIEINPSVFENNTNWCFYYVLENIIKKTKQDVNLKQVYELQTKHFLESLKSHNCKSLISQNILKILNDVKKDQIKIYLIDCNFYISNIVKALGCEKYFDYIIYKDQNIDNSLSYQEISLINPVSWLLKSQAIIPQNTIAITADIDFIKSFMANNVYTVSIGDHFDQTANKSNIHFDINESINFDEILFDYYQNKE